MVNISTASREAENNRAMLQPAATVAGVTVRPVSLGSLQLLATLGNPVAAGKEVSDLDPRAAAELIWVHAAPLDEVLDAVFSAPATVPRRCAEFCMSITTADMAQIARVIAGDQAAIASASASPIPDPDAPESKNGQSRRQSRR